MKFRIKSTIKLDLLMLMLLMSLLNFIEQNKAHGKSMNDLKLNSDYKFDKKLIENFIYLIYSYNNEIDNSF